MLTDDALKHVGDVAIGGVAAAGAWIFRHPDTIAQTIALYGGAVIVLAKLYVLGRDMLRRRRIAVRE